MNLATAQPCQRAHLVAQSHHSSPVRACEKAIAGNSPSGGKREKNYPPAP